MTDVLLVEEGDEDGDVTGLAVELRRARPSGSSPVGDVCFA